MRAEAVKIGRRTNLAACFALARPYLDGFEHDGTLNAVAMTIRGEPAFGTRFNRATTLYPVGPRTRTMMQSCASAAKLRSGGPILPFGVRAKGRLGIPPPRTVIGVPSQAYGQAETVVVPSASFVHCAGRKTTPSGTMPSRMSRHRAVACAPRPRSWAFEYRERSRCGIETTSSRRCSFGVEGTATPIESCRGGPGHCPSGPALSLGVSFRSRRVNQ